MKLSVKTVAATILTAAVAVSLAACGSQPAESAIAQAPAEGKTTTVTVGVAPGPYGDMVTDVISPLLKDAGYKLETKDFNDYIQPNKALAGGQIDANLFQHTQYLEKFAADNNLDLTSLGPVPTLGLGIYSNKFETIDEIADEATVSLANDGSNLARSLGVLEQQGLITVKDDVDPTKATVDDVDTNPKNLVLKPIEAGQIARSLDTVDVALVPGNFAWAAKLDPADALAMEKQSDGVFNVFVVNSKDKDSDFAQKVTDLLTSQEFKDAIADSPFADFGKPWTWK